MIMPKEEKEPTTIRLVEAEEYKALTHSRPEPSSDPPTERPTSQESQASQTSDDTSEAGQASSDTESE